MRGLSLLLEVCIIQQAKDCIKFGIVLVVLDRSSNLMILLMSLFHQGLSNKPDQNGSKSYCGLLKNIAQFVITESVVVLLCS